MYIYTRKGFFIAAQQQDSTEDRAKKRSKIYLPHLPSPSIPKALWGFCLGGGCLRFSAATELSSSSLRGAAMPAAAAATPAS